MTFEKLIQDPVGNLSFVYQQMRADYDKCLREYNTTRFTSVTAKERFGAALEEYRHEIARFKKGIDQIEYKDYVKKAFIYMNKTFMTKLAGEHRQITGWRLFQIVFIVSLICEVIRSEYPNDRTIAEADIEVIGEAENGEETNYMAHSFSRPVCSRKFAADFVNLLFICFFCCIVAHIKNIVECVGINSEST